MNIATPVSRTLGFDNKVFDATATFRTVLEALSRPGTIHPLPAAVQTLPGISAPAMAVLLTLADVDTPVWIAAECDSPELRAHLKFHAGCPITSDPARAIFALLSITSDMTVIKQFSIGTAEYPDRSATVIVECSALIAGKGPVFTGPGIKTDVAFDIENCPAALKSAITRNHQLFPIGVDWLFTSPEELAALPRTTKIEE
ncbi:MAG: phosphonate C-P lyase system protein PhnH [Sneathiella sp.]|nr:MAG: phosphonate C-P lyase system protein PhnH [Sneathiella sp.]